MMSFEELHERANRLCIKLKLMPFTDGINVVLYKIEHDKPMHDLNVCFHELGHLYSLPSNQFEELTSESDIQPVYFANRLGRFISTILNKKQQVDSERSARAIQIGLNIMYNLWPSYNELAHSEESYSEAILRRTVSSPSTANAIAKIMHELHNI